ncbi:fukutin [Strongylocentrotus purpuratus]|uniref:Ribitol-5-phosphate transferase FKTN N-terminal domain-containing protein n=1 Tax=Strongylocentrotus purpuratus TaxID=7668 RepID=A0A7M7PL89_STRPU|nr:fukutin [Strongylocentrotus purpuratus]
MGRAHSQLLLILLTFGAIFVVFQIYVLKSTWMQVEDMGNVKNKKKRRFDDWTPPPDYITVEAFTNIAQEYNVPVFLIEPAILESVWAHRTGTRPSKGRCKFLCRGTDSTTFGIISGHWITQNFLDALWRSGFRSSLSKGKDPRLLSVNELVPPSIIPQHYFFQYETHLVHLVVLYERAESYLWHGAASDGEWEPGRDGQFLWFPLKTLPFGGEREGSFQKMEFADIKIDGVLLTVPKHPMKLTQQVPNSTFIECNYQQAREYLAENGVDDTPKAADFRTRARSILERGMMALDGIGAPFWISSGTCLGWFRECNIIAHSMDVDLGMRIQDYNDRVIPAMEGQGLQLLHLFGKVEDSFELSFARDSIKLDIFFFYEDDDFIWNGGTDAHTGDKYQYVFHQFDLCWTELVGLHVRIPCPTLPYIEANYGTEWDQKVTQWDWKESPPNVRPNGVWEKEEWPYVIQTFPIM